MRVLLGRGMTNPCGKSSGYVTRFVQLLSILVVAGFLFAPKQAAAQFTIDANTFVLALQEPPDPAALAAIQAAIGGQPPPRDVNGVLAAIRAALGDLPRCTAIIPATCPPTPYNPATNAIAAFTGAAAGNAADLATLWAALGGNFFQTYVPFYDPYGFPFIGFPNPWDDMINWVIGGTGAIGYQTLAAALGGNGNAQAVINTILYTAPTGTYATMQSLICGYFGSCANAVTAINLALGGDATAQNDLNTFWGSVITSATASGSFDGQAIAWIQTLGYPGVGAGNCLLDTDGDGVTDCIDPDLDGDGTPNICDLDQNNDGTPDNPDTDGDGLPDACDPTPTGAPPPPPPGGGGTGAGGNGGTGTGGGGSSPPVNDCDNGVSKPLTGSFGADPCELAEDELSMVTADYWDVAGEQFVDHLNELWTNEMLPALKNMTAQWHASVIDQSRQFGSAVDSHNVTKQIKEVQEREVDAKKRVLPNERTCATMSPVAPLAVTNSISNAITHGIGLDVSTRSDAAPGTTAELGPIEEKKSRLQVYCDNFYDPETNAGVSPCTAPVAPSPPTTWMNGDIDIEGFLLKDTVDLSVPVQFIAAKEIITNLTEPNTAERLVPDLIETPSGREYILKREQIQAWRGVAANMVASMISRRTGIPLPEAVGGDVAPPGPPPPPPPPPPPGPMGASRGTFADWLGSLGMRESSGRLDVCNNIGYCGLYQMGALALKEAGCISMGSSQSGSPNHNTQPNYTWIGGGPGCPCGSFAAFKTSQACQTAAVTRYTQNQWGYLGGAAQGMACTDYNGVWLTPSGMLAGAHLVGPGGMRCFLGTGGCGGILTCGGIPCDKSGTLVTEYINRMGGYDIPFAGTNCGPGANSSSSATGVPPPPPKPVGETVREIRERAGVPADLISDKPSYNEIMLAMTKERFLDPDYYTRMLNDLSALKQEQASVSAYITMQLQDIYLLQEQINILLAARSSMRLDQGNQGEMNRGGTTPMPGPP